MALAILEANLTSLAFTSPYVGPGGWDLLRYDVGRRVNVSWTTPYELTTLEVWRGLGEDGSFAVDVLAANCTQNVTSFMWNVSTSGGPDAAQSMFFRLQKGDAPNTCDRCSADSATFRVSDPSAQSSSSSTSSMPPTSTADSATVATASISPRPPASGISESARLGIGLGVGLGVGAVILALGVLFFCLNRRKKRHQQARQFAQDQPGEARTSLASAGADSWMSKHSSKMSYHSRFEFETPDGSVREGSEALWPRTEKPSWLQRAPSKAKNPFFRS